MKDNSRTVAVRFEGGLGDHVLAMRVLPFVRGRYPEHEIIVYSDSGGHQTPLQITAMSPYVANVVPVRSSGYARRLEDIYADDLQVMRSADVLIDAWGERMCVDAATILDLPLFDILAQRAELIVPTQAARAAADRLRNYRDATFIGLNLSTHGAGLLRNQPARVRHLLERLLENPSVIVLNVFSTRYDFPHWPEPLRSMRRGRSLDDAYLLEQLCSLSERIVPCVDLPITTVVALLQRCRYFIGVDNGIKHLAWGLRLPLTYFHPGCPSMRHRLRWMPDAHRMLMFDCSEADLAYHTEGALAAVARG